MASANPPVNGNGHGNGHSGADHNFGSCCEALESVLNPDEFSPTFGVDEAGVLFMAVGCAEVVDDEDDDDDPDIEGEFAWLDQAVMFCPFCGTPLQTPQEIEAKIA